MCLDFSSLVCAKHNRAQGIKGLPSGKGDFKIPYPLGDPTKTKPVFLWVSGVDSRRRVAEMSAGAVCAPAAARDVGHGGEGPRRGCPRRKAEGRIHVGVRV